MTINPYYNFKNKLQIYFLTFLILCFNAVSAQKITIEKLKDLTGGENIPAGEGFGSISYQSGPDGKADYFQVDAYNGISGPGYHLNSIVMLRMNGGKYLLDGINNDVMIACNGITDSITRTTAIKASLATGNLAYVRTEVPGMANSSWQRNILYLKETGLIVIDRTMARKTSDFDIECSWTFPKDHEGISFTPDMIKSVNGAVISFANQGSIKTDSGNIVKETFPVRLLEGDFYDIGNLVYYDHSMPSKTIRKTGKNNFMISDSTDLFICLDGYQGKELKLSADFALIGSDRIFLSGFNEMDFGKTANLKSDVPVSVLWNIKDNKIEICSENNGNLTFESEFDKYLISFDPGKSTYEDIKVSGHMAEKITAILANLKKSSYSDILSPSKIEPENINRIQEWQVKGDSLLP